jgi:CubicO group peptidase (beta-lactamase class C family)
MLVRMSKAISCPIFTLVAVAGLWSCGEADVEPSGGQGGDARGERPSASAPDVISSAEEYDFGEVDRALERAARLTRHLAVVIRHHGEVVYSRSFGGGDADTPTPIASVAKWLSAATVLALDDAGYLSIDDPIDKYLPELDDDKGAIRVRQLLSHTSGFAPHGTMAFRSVMGRGIRIGSVARLNRLEAPPGGRFCYGRVSFQIAGEIAERVTGQAWGEIFRQRITGPCGMRNTWFPREKPVLAEHAFSSAGDMSRFLEMILDQGMAPGGVRVLSEEMIARMTENHSGDLPIECKPTVYRPGQTYGLGVWRDVLDPTSGEAMVVSHDGSSGFKGIVDFCRDATISVAARFVESDDRGSRRKAKKRFQEIRKLLRQAVPGPCG